MAVHLPFVSSFLGAHSERAGENFLPSFGLAPKDSVRVFLMTQNYLVSDP